MSFDPDDANSEPSPPLAKAVDWVNVELDLGDGLQTYRRDTNVMPQWAGSSWYQLRYIDPTNPDAFCDKENERYWTGPRPEIHGPERSRRRRPVRRRRRARGAAPAVLAVLAQGAVRPRLRQLERAVPPPVQPGLHPGLRVHRRARRLRARGRGGGEGRQVLPPGRRGQPRVREDGQVASRTPCRRTRSARSTAPTPCACTRCRWVRWTPPARGRPRTSSVRSASCSALWRVVVDEESGAVRVTDDAPDGGHAARAEQGDRRCQRGLRGAARQHGGGQADRVHQPPHQGVPRRCAPRRWWSRWC